MLSQNTKFESKITANDLSPSVSFQEEIEVISKETLALEELADQAHKIPINMEQALLIMMDHYKKQGIKNADELKAIRMIYLSGPKAKKELDIVRCILDDGRKTEILSQYDIPEPRIVLEEKEDESNKVMNRIKISVGQALLIMIDHYKKFGISSSKIKTLLHDQLDMLQTIKMLYLSGVETKVHYYLVNNILEDGKELCLLDQYRVSTESSIIDNDPTRRYFETHLAYETLLDCVPQLNKEKLSQFMKLLCQYAGEDILHSAVEGISDRHFFNELKHKFKYPEKYYLNFSESDKKALMNLYFCGYVGGCLAQRKMFFQPSLEAIYDSPNSIYNKDGYRRQAKPTTPVSHFFHTGIQKSGMPVPNMPIDRIEACSPFQSTRFPDRYIPDNGSAWIRHSRRLLVHPFVAGISGTMLAQIRSIVFLANQKNVFSFETFEQLSLYLKCFMARMVYISGSHSFHELIYVLQYPQVSDEFNKVIKGYSTPDLNTLFTGPAFDRALTDTIKYNQIILDKSQINDDIKTKVRLRI
ncbi:MAG: hypothetical protein ABI597_06335 [Gammaproteobacteria bacterium]